MTGDDALRGVAVVELVARLGGTIELDDGLALLGETCPHSRTSLYLTGMLCHVSDLTGIDLQQLLDQERSEALAVEGPAGMA